MENVETTKLDEALALGYGSIEDMNASLATARARAEQEARARQYQVSPEAAARKATAAAKFGISVESIAWIEPDTASSAAS